MTTKPTTKDWNGAFHPGSLDSLDSISSCKFNLSRLAAWLTCVKAYIAGNKLEASQPCVNPPHHQYPNESTIDLPLAKNTVDVNPITHVSNSFGDTRQYQTEKNKENQSHYPAGIEWGHV